MSIYIFLMRIYEVAFMLIGSVAELGDFNAHLGGENCPGDQNLQGVLLQTVLERCEVSAVSQGALASGPV